MDDKNLSLKQNSKWMTNFRQACCAPLKNSLELLTNVDHHCVGASRGISGPFLQSSGELLGKLDSRGLRASKALSPPWGSGVSIFPVAKTWLWFLVDRLKDRIWMFEACLVFTKWFCRGWEVGARSLLVHIDEIHWVLTLLTFLTHHFSHVLFLDLLGKSSLHLSTEGRLLPGVSHPAPNTFSPKPVLGAASTVSPCVSWSEICSLDAQTCLPSALTSTLSDLHPGPPGSGPQGPETDGPILLSIHSVPLRHQAHPHPKAVYHLCTSLCSPTSRLRLRFGSPSSFFIQDATQILFPSRRWFFPA